MENVWDTPEARHIISSVLKGMALRAGTSEEEERLKIIKMLRGIIGYDKEFLKKQRCDQCSFAFDGDGYIVLDAKDNPIGWRCTDCVGGLDLGV
jgi:hypothetical protein